MMKISPADALADRRAGGGETLLAFVGADAAPGRWLLLEGGVVAARGEADERLSIHPAVRTALAVPGAEVAIHWLELADSLAPAQAAGVARLMLADASAEPLGEMHVAVGRPERGLTPVGLVPARRMAQWLAAALASGSDPDLVVPESLLLIPPPEGLARRDSGPVPDYRGIAVAFSVEPELAGLLSGDAQIEAVDEDAFEAGLAEALAAPAMNLRQGAFAKRRQWKLEEGRLRRMMLLAAALAAATLVVQVATIMRYTFAADRLEAETAAIGAAPNARPTFAAVASLLFEAVRATPNAELTRIDYRPDGALSATVQVDSPATLAAFRARAEASGLAVEGGDLQSGGGRPAAELVLRPA